EINDSLIAQAVLNAKSKAEKALAPLDHKIIGVKAVSLSEFGMPSPIPYYTAGYDESAALKASTPVFSSDQEVSTTANVIFVIGSN
ncbi:MAG: SIMPL domain-containing protein, partial [Nitrosopumilales archaeon]|nr:SIMPL domain-containing protein [Nitrosopumilales archaeon]